MMHAFFETARRIMRNLKIFYAKVRKVMYQAVQVHIVTETLIDYCIIKAEKEKNPDKPIENTEYSP